MTMNVQHPKTGRGRVRHLHRTQASQNKMLETEDGKWDKASPFYICKCCHSVCRSLPKAHSLCLCSHCWMGRPGPGPRNHEVVLQPSLLVSPDPHNFNPSDDVLVEELEQGQAGKMVKLEIGKFEKSTKPLEDACPVVLF